jgi:S-disulfanyl-L-cysteine oxidoreductase SoxD
MIHGVPVRAAAVRVFVGVTVYACALLTVFSTTGQAGQARALKDGVYSAVQAKRGEELYQQQCGLCHGDTLGGAIGPPLTGEAFLSPWAGRTLADLVDTIETTMPLGAGGTLSRPQSIDLVTYMLQVGGFPAGALELGADALPQVSFPAAAPSGAGSRPSIGRTTSSTLGVS